jgi:predicted  nucleic acid-binding Zn-ribbon protein
MNKRIDEALAGSNTIKSYTDQGSKGDPNYEAGGIGVNINRERFNDWGYPGSAEWRIKRQEEIATADAKVKANADAKVKDVAANAAEAAKTDEQTQKDREMVDKRSIKTVKVDATGKVAVNIGGGAGDATLGSKGLFKDTTPERKTQMVDANVGPKTGEAPEHHVAAGGS